MSNEIINNEDLKDINIRNIWVDYSSYYTNDLKHLIEWILKRKYLITCPIQNIDECNKEYINLYKEYREIDTWNII